MPIKITLKQARFLKKSLGNLGKTAENVIRRGGPIDRNPMATIAGIGATIGGGMGASNMGREERYKAYGAQRARRAVRGVVGGAFGGALLGARFADPRTRKNAIYGAQLGAGIMGASAYSNSGRDPRYQAHGAKRVRRTLGGVGGGLITGGMIGGMFRT